MQCKIHPDENGVNTCNQCGIWICDKCSFERSGRIFCPNCAAQEAASIPAGSTVYTLPIHARRYVSWGVLFLFSVIIPLPGLNYMYMGLIKRGLVAMSVFFGTIYMASQFNGGISMLFGFAIPIILLASIFDGFQIRSRINAGEIVTDDINDITSFIRRNRTFFVGFLLALLAIQVIGGIIPGLTRILPVLIVIWIIHTLFLKK